MKTQQKTLKTKKERDIVMNNNKLNQHLDLYEIIYKVDNIMENFHAHSIISVVRIRVSAYEQIELTFFGVLMIGE